MSTEFLKEKISFYKEIQDFCTKLFAQTYYKLENKNYKTTKISKEHFVKVAFHYYPEFNSGEEQFVISHLSATQRVNFQETFIKFNKHDIIAHGHRTTSDFFFTNIKNRKEEIDPKVYWRSFYAIITHKGIILKAYSYHETSRFILETNPYMWDDVNYLPFSETVYYDTKDIAFSRMNDSDSTYISVIQPPEEVNNISFYHLRKDEKSKEFRDIISKMKESENKCIFIPSDIFDLQNNHKWFDFGIKNPKAFQELNSFVKDFNKEEFDYYKEFDSSFKYDPKKLKSKNIYEIFFIRKLNHISIIYQKMLNIQKFEFITSNIIGYIQNETV